LYMNKRGLGQFYDREDIEDELIDYGRGMVNEAILALYENKFIVLTGENNQKLFIKNPSWAHTLRVYLSDAKKRAKIEKYLEKPIQLNLDIAVDWQRLDTDEQKSDIIDE